MLTVQHSFDGDVFVEVGPMYSMIIPVVTPGMKDLCQGVRFGIDPRQVSSFVKVTIDGCKREVIKLIAAAMYLRNDVLYVKSGQR